MCGIVAVVGEIGIAQEKALRTLLVLDSLRGEDSTGIASIGKFAGAEVNVAKCVGDPFQLFDSKQYEAAMRMSTRAIIGHNRYATMGGVSRQTAHPFENDGMVGVHNGTLRNKHVLANATHFKVDSENLYHHINTKGLDDALKIIDGAWALVWWDKYAEELNLLRNKERPLFYSRSVTKEGVWDGKTLYIASEGWMLDVALNRQGLFFTKPTMLEEDKLHTIPIGVNGVLGAPVITDAAGTYEPPAHNPIWGYNNNNKQVSNVISLNKEGTVDTTGKKPVTDIAVVEVYDRKYLNSKNVVLELLNEGRDKDGMNFISCFDPKHQYCEIRLYPRKNQDHFFDHMGQDIQGDINGWCMGGAAGRGYYKVAPDSVKLLVTLEEDLAEEAIIVNGKEMTKTRFEKDYPSCAWCSSPLFFGQGNKFSLGMECFCPDCSTNPEVLSSTSF